MRGLGDKFMRHKTIYGVIIAVIACGCNSPANEKSIVTIDTTKSLVIVNKKSDRRIFGERLKLTGDFNGDGKIDTVFESYISKLTGKEDFKILDSTNWEDNVGLIIENKPVSRLYLDIEAADTFIVTKDPQQSGVGLLENLGDLNGDKGDELGYIIKWADESNLNTYHIVTLTNEKKWKELFNFPINESVNYETENLLDGKFILMKIGPNKIKYKYYSDSASIGQGEKTLQ